MRERKTSRNILPYFIESNVWKKYKESKVDNYSYWINEDPSRAARMFSAKNIGLKGYSVQEYLYDMIDCVYCSNLSVKTQRRLYKEIDEVENYHEAAGTLQEEM